MVAIVGMLLFINRQLAGMLELMMYWILTFPILMYTARYGVKSALVPAVSMVLLSFMIAQPTTIFYLVSCMVIGILYGAGVRKKWKNGTLLSMTALFTFVSYFITTIVFAAFFGYDPSEDVELVKTLMEVLNVNLSLPLGTIVSFVVFFTAVLMTILQTMCIHMIANTVLKRMHIEVVPMKNIFDIKVSPYIGYGILAIYVLFLLRNVIKLNQDAYAIVFALYLFAKPFAIGYGALILLCILLLKKKRAWSIVIMISLFIPIINDIIAVIGILDMIVDLRLRLFQRLKRGVMYGATRKH